MSTNQMPGDFPCTSQCYSHSSLRPAPCESQSKPSMKLEKAKRTDFCGWDFPSLPSNYTGFDCDSRGKKKTRAAALFLNIIWAPRRHTRPGANVVVATDPRRVRQGIASLGFLFWFPLLVTGYFALICLCPLPKSRTKGNRLKQTEERRPVATVF